jgi:hypothetical protein
MVEMDDITEITIEEMIDLIREGYSVDILYEESPNPHPNIITLVCGDKYCNDVREIKPVITTHSPTHILIRSKDKDKIITSWKEFYVHSARIYSQFRIDHTSGTIEVQRKENQTDRYTEIKGQALEVR